MPAPLFLRIEPQGPVPIYRQIVDQVRMAIAGGQVQPGERMPGLRELAEELAINLQTVQKAYGELVREGTLAQQRGLGTFVAPAGSKRRGTLLKAALAVRVQQLVRDARTAGMERRELTQFVNEAWSQED